jgi:hypothetical protein
VSSHFAAQGQWKQSLEAFHLAVTSPSLAPVKNQALVEYLRAARGARLAGAISSLPSELQRPPPDSSIAFLAALVGPLEKTDRPGAAAYKELSAGRLAQALKLAADPSVPEGARQVLQILAGASDGASPDFVSAAMAANAEEAERWLLDALRIREQGHVAALRISGLDERMQIELAEALGDPAMLKNPARLEALAKGLSLKQQGAISASAVIVLREKAPAAWRSQAKELLFVTERPYFR